MAPPRTFDLDVLNQIIRDHPGWSNHQYAQAITEYERGGHCRLNHTDRQGRSCGDPHYGPIKANTVSQAISQNRTTWEAIGVAVRERPYGRLLPWPGLPFESLMSTPARHLKTLEKLRRGRPVSDTHRRQALKFEERLRVQKRILDIRDNGVIYDRLAEPHELDGHGNLIKITADVRLDWLAKVGVIESQEDYLSKLEDQHDRQVQQERQERQGRRAG